MQSITARISIRITVFWVALILAGCTVTATHQQPSVLLPTHWELTHTIRSTPTSDHASLDWHDFVTDETLRHLIELALSNNRDLRQSLLNIEAARAQYRIERADHLPALNLQSTSTLGHIPVNQANSGQRENLTNWETGIGVNTFELDLFGRVHSLSQAAFQEYLATAENTRAVQISLITEIIQHYLKHNGAQRHHLIAMQTFQSMEQTHQLVFQRYQRGAVSALEYQETRGLVQDSQLELERTTREINLAKNTLGLLVGVHDLHTYLARAPASESFLVQNIAIGLPSTLLTIRPDIQAAEHQLRARSASIDAARAAFFPQISLTGLFGSASTELLGLFNGAQRTWTFTPQIILPIFSAGRNRTNLALAVARRDAAIARYEKTIQTAFQEVSDALIATDTLGREEILLQKRVKNSQQTLQLSEIRYRAGLDDHLRYLDAQRHNLNHQYNLVAISTQRQIALATLFKAMGGKWSKEYILKNHGRNS